MKTVLRKNAPQDKHGLSRLELICLTLAASGLHTGDISRRLGLGEAEAESLLFQAQAKLGARNRLHAIAIAIQQDLVGIEVG